MIKLAPKTRDWLLVTFIVLFIVAAVLLLVLLTGQESHRDRLTSLERTQTQENEQPTAQTKSEDTPQAATQTSPTPIFQPVDLQIGDISTDYNQMGVIIFSMTDGIYQHLFAYHPQFLPITRLTNNLWNDCQPAFSADSTQLAYASTQGGYWDIYVLDLSTYQQIQVTNTPGYDGAPSWSPDGKWLVYESDSSGNLDIFIKSTEDLDQPPIQLTTNPEADFAPQWSPDGRKILFTSLQSGNEEIWMANLDEVDDRFENLTNRASTIDGAGWWSPDGETVLFQTTVELTSSLYLISQNEKGGTSINLFAGGNLAAWHPEGSQLAAVFHNESNSSLAIIDTETRTSTTPYHTLAGRVNGITWGYRNLDLLLPLLDRGEEASAPASWPMEIDSEPNIPGDRYGLDRLADTNAPYPYLHDAVDEAFTALRTTISEKTGWDFLAQLKNAYIPITSPTSPDILENWLYTGRAIQLDDLPSANHWMVTVREDINGKTFWRIYLRAIDQSGMHGAPLRQRIWLFEQRTQGSPLAYEQGGNLSQDIPHGYWIDFTDLAAQFGWYRIPALLNWRTYFPGTQHMIYVHQSGMDLEQALLELYPAEALLPPATNSVVPIKTTPTPEPET
ncbi:MAG: PD40 domain-containing protein [Anaerolineae bacterium]|nr:PD40 domain-containing protein [Anaerolineae bacterium]